MSPHYTIHNPQVYAILSNIFLQFLISISRVICICIRQTTYTLLLYLIYEKWVQKIVNVKIIHDTIFCGKIYLNIQPNQF